MAQSDYKAGLRGASNLVRSGQELLDWEAGNRAYLANKDLANQMREANDEDAITRKREAERNVPQNDVLVAALQRQQAKEWNPIGTVLYFLYEVVTLIWPAGIVGAIIGGVLAFGLYWMFGVNAQFLVLIGFIIGWGRSIWVYPLFGGTSISTWLYLRKVKKVKP